MLPGMELMGCPVEVPGTVLQHVVKIESSFNPYAIGVVRGRLARQPRNLAEAVATARMLEDRGFNFSLGLAQVNRYNLAKYGITSYAAAFDKCTNLLAGSRILRECHQRAGGHWGKSFSCYYSGNFTTGYREGYVQKIEQSMFAAMPVTAADNAVIPVIGAPSARDRAKAASTLRKTPGAPPSAPSAPPTLESLLTRRAGGTPSPAPALALPATPSPLPPASAPQPPASGDEAFVF